MLREAFDAFQPRAADRGVEFVLEDPGLAEQVPVDKDQLQHALQNLLENALAHTPTGGRITLAGGSRERPRRFLGDGHRLAAFRPSICP